MFCTGAWTPRSKWGAGLPQKHQSHPQQQRGPSCSDDSSRVHVRGPARRAPAGEAGLQTRAQDTPQCCSRSPGVPLQGPSSGGRHTQPQLTASPGVKRPPVTQALPCQRHILLTHHLVGASFWGTECCFRTFTAPAGTHLGCSGFLDLKDLLLERLLTAPWAGTPGHPQPQHGESSAHLGPRAREGSEPCFPEPGVPGRPSPRFAKKHKATRP